MTAEGGSVTQKVEAEAQASWLAQLLDRAQSIDHELQQLVQAANKALAAVQATQEQAEKALQATEAGAEKAKASAQGADGAQQGAASARTAAEEARAAVETLKINVSQLAADTEAIKREADGHKAATAAAKQVAEAARDATTQCNAVAEKARDEAETAQKVAKEAAEQAVAAQQSADEALEATKAVHVNAASIERAIELIRVEGRKTSDGLAEALVAAGKQRDGAEAARVAAEGSSATAAVEAKRAAEAHNLSTTAGLAGAFNLKAQSTKSREWFWGVALVLSLVAVAWIGGTRYSDLKALLQSKPETWTIAAQFLLTIFGVGAPVWLAWMSTRMISKNFALTEDYAYKASLAQAYVGFRQEARGLDPLLEQRLFAAAITQLDANPVRFLDAAHPGSPLQDLLQQPFMRDVLMQDPNLKARLVEWLKSRFNAKLKATESTGANVTPISAATGIQQKASGEAE